MRSVRTLVAALAAALLPLAANAQQPTRATDSLRLGALQAAAERRDPRARQFGLLAELTAPVRAIKICKSPQARGSPV